MKHDAHRYIWKKQKINIKYAVSVLTSEFSERSFLKTFRWQVKASILKANYFRIWSKTPLQMFTGEAALFCPTATGNSTDRSNTAAAFLNAVTQQQRQLSDWTAEIHWAREDNRESFLFLSHSPQLNNTLLIHKPHCWEGDGTSRDSGCLLCLSAT